MKSRKHKTRNRKPLLSLALFFTLLLSCFSTLCQPLPEITVITPTSGPIGTLVTITGSNLDDPTTFTIGGTQAIVISNDGNKLVSMVMPGTVNGPISLTTSAGTITTGNFEVTAPVLPVSQQGPKNVPDDMVGSAFFGLSVALSADGSTAIVSAPWDNNYVGAAWIYTRNAGVWVKQQKLLPPTPVPNENFGAMVDISADGNTVIIGHEGDSNGIGAAYIFVRENGIWSLQQKLVGNNYVIGNNGSVNQGATVALSADGNIALIGGPGDHESGDPWTGSGAAWVFHREGTAWEQDGSKITRTGVMSLGAWVCAMADDGKTLLLNDGGNGIYPYVYQNNNWQEQGNSLMNNGKSILVWDLDLSADGRFAIVGGGGSYYSGNNYFTQSLGGFIFERVNGIWQGPVELPIVPDSPGSEYVGVDLSADGSIAIVGGTMEVDKDTTFLYAHQGNTWVLQSKLHGTGAIGNAFQTICKISSDGQTVIVGGGRDNNTKGAFWVYNSIPNSPTALSSSDITYRSFKANWDFAHNSNYTLAHYELLVSQTSDFNDFIQYNVSKSDLSFTVYGLKPSTAYYWKVRFVDQSEDPDLQTEYSQVLTVTTTSNPLPDNTQLWGTTLISPIEIAGGGIFRINADGSSFNEISDNYYTHGLIQASDGYVYSSAIDLDASENPLQSGVCKLLPDGSGIHTFFEIDPIHGYPDNKLMQASDGNLYGTLYHPETKESSIYKMSVNGTFQKIFTFQEERSYSHGALVEGNDGFLYGVQALITQTESKSIVYKINKDGSGYTTLYNFPVIPEVAPYNRTQGWFVKDSNGDLFGKFYFGDVNKCKIVKVSNSLVEIVATLPQSDDISAGLIIGSDGFLYGTTWKHDYSFTPGSNSIFKISKNGSGYTTLHTFFSTQNIAVPFPEGVVANSELLEYNGKLYGTCMFRGSTLGDAGTIFSINLDGSNFTKLYDFVEEKPNMPRFGLVIVDPSAVANLSIFSESANGQKNTEVLIPIKATNFENIQSTQFSITWNPAVATFVGTEQLGLSGLDNTNFGTNQANNGILTFSWNESVQTLSDGSTIFSIRLKLTGNYGASTPVTISAQPIAIEVVDSNFETIDVTTQAGIVTIDSEMTISGKIKLSNNEPLQDVNVNLSGAPQSTVTDALGNYSFIATAGTSYTLAPEKINTPNDLTGIDVQDIASLRRHILGVEALDNPYKVIAADVNESHTLSTLDIVLIRALILDIKDEFPNGRQWSFVTSDYVFPNANSPFPFLQTKTLSQVDGEVSQDFIAMKLGDVNNSFENNGGRESEMKEVVFVIDPGKIGNDGMLEIPVQVKNFEDIAAYQFTINWDEDRLEYVGMINKNTDASFGENKTDQGTLTTAWDDASGKSKDLSYESDLFHLQFKKKIAEASHEDITINGSRTLVAIYDQNLKAVGYKVEWKQREEDPTQFQLYQNFPNAFSDKTVISFSVPQQGAVEIEIMDITGRIVKTLQGNFEAGRHYIEWDGSDKAGNTISSGLYVYTAKYGKTMKALKMVKR